MDSQTKKLIFALLFFYKESGVPFSLFRQTMKLSKQKISDVKIAHLLQEFNFREYGLQVCLENSIIKARVDPEVLKIIKQLQQSERDMFLNTAKLEVLALIAYKQPISRGFINHIRGKNSDSTLQWLVQNDFVTRVISNAKKQKLFITTKKFNEYFQISSLKELPNTTPYLVSETNSQEEAN